MPEELQRRDKLRVALTAVLAVFAVLLAGVALSASTASGTIIALVGFFIVSAAIHFTGAIPLLSVLGISRALRRSLDTDQASPALPAPPAKQRKQEKARGAAWRRGEDIRDEIDKYAELEQQLLENRRKLLQRAQENRAEAEKLVGLEGRQPLIRNYRVVADQLEGEAEGQHRDLLRVWKVHAKQSLHMGLAIAARNCPQLPDIAVETLPPDQVRPAIHALARSETALRAFVRQLEEVGEELDGAVPTPPPGVEIPPSFADEVAAERGRVEGTLQRVRLRMDRFADVLAYKRNWCETREIASETRLDLSSMPNADSIIDEYMEATRELEAAGEAQEVDLQAVLHEFSGSRDVSIHMEAAMDAAAEVAAFEDDASARARAAQQLKRKQKP